MSKPDSTPGLLAVRQLLDEAQVERVATMTGPELDEELRSQGLDPHDAFDLEAMLPPPVAKPAPVLVRPLARRADLWLIAASFAALGLSVAVAAFQADPAQPETADGPAPEGPAGPAALARAEALRDEAGRACSQKLWYSCAQRLDEARALDPEGDAQERVRDWRKAIAAAARTDPALLEQFRRYNSKTDGTEKQRPQKH